MFVCVCVICQRVRIGLAWAHIVIDAVANDLFYKLFVVARSNYVRLRSPPILAGRWRWEMRLNKTRRRMTADTGRPMSERVAAVAVGRGLLLTTDAQPPPPLLPLQWRQCQWCGGGNVLHDWLMDGFHRHASHAPINAALSKPLPRYLTAVPASRFRLLKLNWNLNSNNVRFYVSENYVPRGLRSKPLYRLLSNFKIAKSPSDLARSLSDECIPAGFYFFTSLDVYTRTTVLTISVHDINYFVLNFSRSITR